MIKRIIVRMTAVCLIIAGLGLAVFFGRKAYISWQEYETGDQAYEKLAESVKEEKEPDEGPAPSEAEENELGEEIPTVNLKAAQDINSDIVAWLNCPDTVINYPICQGEDNDYYLTHLADGTYNRNGCLFMDCGNANDFSDDNTIIYGHHMASGKMFASLVRYTDQSYYDTHPIMYLTVADRQYMIEIFSGYATTANSSAYMINCGSKNEFAGWLKEICEKSDFKADAMAISTSDQIVTLSTCAYDFRDARYVVHGRLKDISS